MKTLLAAGAACALALSLAGCTSAGSQAVAPISQAIAQGLPHCHITGSLNTGVGGLAGTGTGVAQNVTFDCPAQPWPAASLAGAPVDPPVAPTP